MKRKQRSHKIAPQKTQIICTIGPASQEVSTLVSFIKNGMRVARLNFSHGTHENHSLMIENIRAAAKECKKQVLIMQDLQGPKIRIQNLKSPLTVKAGQEVVIGKDFALDVDISKTVKVKDSILIEDGIIELVVSKVSAGLIHAVSQTDGVILLHKGVNLPHIKLNVNSVTEKDLEDLKFGLTKHIDLVAMSFVRTAADVKLLKKLISQHLPKGFMVPEVVVKIEKPEGVKNFSNILKVTDWVMVARGDLGVELPASHIPVIQKMIVHKCRMVHKPVIVATQMLNSMIENPRPTRAEVSDVANAVMEGANYVMLSGETAFGKYPLQATTQMHEIILVAEKSPYVKRYSL